MNEMKSSRIWLVTGIVLMMAFSACNQKSEQQEVRKVKVKCLSMAPSQVTGGKNYVGTVEEKDGAVVSFNVVGTVTRVYADEGQMVKKGQALAEVDGQNVRHSYEMSASTLRQAEDAYQRLSTLYKRGTLPEIRMVEMETDLAKARAAEQISRKTLNDIVLRAPFSGYVAKRMVHEGASATPGFGAFKLVKIDQVKVNLSVPENEIGQIKVGQTMAFTVPALGDKQFTGRVNTKGVQASFLSHSYDVKLLVPNERNELLPGMVCSAVLHTKSNLGSDYVLPQDAVKMSGGNTFVWLVEAGKAKKQLVNVGEVTNMGVVIKGGLKTGDKVIVEGSDKVSEDMLVEETKN